MKSLRIPTHGAFKLHYERIKQNQYKKNLLLNLYIRVSQQEVPKSLQKLSKISLEIFLHLQDITSYPMQQMTHQSELYRLQNLKNTVALGIQSLDQS